MIAVGEDDTADEDVYDSAAFMITDAPETTRDRDSNMVLFGPTEVLLDNQAVRSSNQHVPVVERKIRTI
jgi:hypothetical protein